MIEHCVWKTPAPPVSTVYWSQEDWTKFEAGYRPQGYVGKPNDQDAWAAFLEQKRAEACLSLLPKST